MNYTNKSKIKISGKNQKKNKFTSIYHRKERCYNITYTARILNYNIYFEFMYRIIKHSKPCKAVIHDHPSVSWREVLKSITGEVRKITLLSRTGINTCLNASSSHQVAMEDLIPVGVGANGLLIKPRVSLI